ncbi:putative GTP-binding protein 6 [Episyrphus balteatus]|uniref:putative GTP-binding protein 6 n=1 Tax=Episyrphus balteatus TaxID=286459 RepID=UPI0024859BE1|nr:putative GTP-binding protein 6 [Episyrphus balteatus]
MLRRQFVNLCTNALRQRWSPALLTEICPIRFKYTQFKGVKGIRNRKNMFESNKMQNNDDEDEENTSFNHGINLEDRDYEEVANTAMNLSHNQNIEQHIFVLQPYIKWGAKKSTSNPDLQLKEAEALVHSLPNWHVQLSMKVPLESLEKRILFGTGKLEELKKIVTKGRSGTKPLTALFISKGTLSFAQKRTLESEFGIPVLDRYSVVIQILRLHATTAEARLQVAMAEIPYIWGQMKDANLSMSRKQGYALSDIQKEMLKTREKKLKDELEKIRSHRKLIRSKRKQKNFPIVAVVGYTNAGKTSLIKALTNEQTMQPRDQLFATLDVTAHAGMLPCNLEVIYMDTVGFMSDLPTGLIECFIATLEDAMMADVIIHVQDLSHESWMEQRIHVEKTLESLAGNLSHIENLTMPPIINVGNKTDLISNLPTENLDESLKMVSSKTFTGIHELVDDVEKKVLETTGRKKITMRVKNGGPETPWLYKNAAVVNARADPKNEESILIDVIITDSKMQQFKHYFCKK